MFDRSSVIVFKVFSSETFIISLLIFASSSNSNSHLSFILPISVYFPVVGVGVAVEWAHTVDVARGFMILLIKAPVGGVATVALILP